MSRIQIRSFALLTAPCRYICPNCRPPSSRSLRPLHASPALRKPRSRDFFSSNALGKLRAPDIDDNVKPQSPRADASHVEQQSKRKSRASAAKTSLRRVAVEAQRSKQSAARDKSSREDSSATREVSAYAVAEQFNLAKVNEILRQNGYEPDPCGTGLYPQVIHIQVPLASIHRTAKTAARDLSASEVGDIFIFPSGTVVAWSLPEAFTSYFATKTLLPAAESQQNYRVESEDLEYVEDATRENSIIKGDTIILGTKEEPPSASRASESLDLALTKIAFSSGFARSTKLAVLETMLSDYFNSTRDIPNVLSKGSRLPYNRSFILRKTGQLLSIRAQLNLYSELTDSLPDLFWDSRHELGLEGYYDQVGRALDVNIRIKVLNEKMDYAQEIASVLREMLNEKHGHSLEWIIIALIAMEIGLEVFRLWREGYLQVEQESAAQTHDSSEAST